LLQFWVGTNAFTVLLDPVVYASGVIENSLPRARGRKRKVHRKQYPTSMQSQDPFRTLSLILYTDFHTYFSDQYVFLQPL